MGTPYIRSFAELAGTVHMNGRSDAIETCDSGEKNPVSEMQAAVAKDLSDLYQGSKRYSVISIGDAVVVKDYETPAMTYRMTAEGAVRLSVRPEGAAARVIDGIVAAAVQKVLWKRHRA